MPPAWHDQHSWLSSGASRVKVHTLYALAYGLLGSTTLTSPDHPCSELLLTAHSRHCLGATVLPCSID